MPISNYPSQVWELKTGICVKTLRGHTAPVLAIQAEADRLISGGGDKTIRIWNVDTGYCVSVLQGHGDAVTCLTLDKDHQRIISGSLDRSIKVWSVASHQCLKTLDWMSNEGHTGVIRSDSNIYIYKALCLSVRNPSN